MQNKTAWDLVREYRQAAQRASKILQKQGDETSVNSIRAFELYVSFTQKMIAVKLQ